MRGKPVLDGELAPNVAIQFRLRILHIQDEVDLSWMGYKEMPCEETYQSYYSWVGVLISKMSSAPVFKDIRGIWEDYQEILNALDVGNVPIKAFKEVENIHFKLNDKIKNSPIYDFEFAEEKAIELE